MWQVFIGSLFLSTIHALIPNHWIPLVTLSKTEKWSRSETYFATFITGFSHTASTIIIGFVVGFIGVKLSESYELVTKIAAPVILLLIGLVYIFLDIRKERHHHHHNHDHFKIEKAGKKAKNKWAILISLSVAMFLTPCVEIEAYYFQAGTIGWAGIFIVSAVYLVMTLLIMFLLVNLGLKGIDRFNSHYLEHHDKRITGIVLVILAVLAYFVEF
jgi:nickel/cobalt transporter (NicO) family protein